ncbi:hypothetical protein IFR04_005812 [Cadophora malorum]|uniref:Uncharacterized protein n=1 Tax=Cadophora malorum TaxID=108018 RepID=A0A8H7WBH0_9HELO|nr:hypothetical protein IFR04_005812 [Cadophora malorum]
MCDARVENCCNHDDPVYGVRGGVQIMHALHGFEKAVTKHDWRYGGCPGLEEVHFIVKSTLWQRGAGEIDWTVGLRPATMDVFTPVDLAVKQRLKRQIAWVNDDYGIPRTGKFAWADYKPLFRFSSLAPVSTSGNVYEGIILGAEDVTYMEEKDSGFLKDVGQRSGCSIQFAPSDPGAHVREIGFAGTEEAVVQAKECLITRLMVSSSGTDGNFGEQRQVPPNEFRFDRPEAE